MLRGQHTKAVVLPGNLRLKPHRAYLVARLVCLNIQEAKQGAKPDSLLHRPGYLLLQGGIVVLLSGKHMHRLRVQAHCGAGCVHTDVASADQDDFLPAQIRRSAVCHHLQEICRRDHILPVRAVHRQAVSQLCAEAEVDRVGLPANLLKGDIPSNPGVGFYLNVAGSQDHADILIQPDLGKPVFRYPVTEHTAQHFMLVINNDLMPHQRKVESGRQSGRSSADDGNRLAGRNILPRPRHGVCTNGIHRILFQTPDVDRIVYDASAAFSFTGMLTDHRTGCRKGIPVADHPDRPGVILLFDQGNITGHIHMSGTERNTGNGLQDIFRAAVSRQVAFILIREFL